MKASRCCLRIVLIYLALLVGLIILLTSCVTYERCVDKFGVQSTDTIRITYTKEVPVIVHVPADSAKLQATLDSLLAGKVIQTDTSKNLSIKAYYDDLSNSVKIEAKQKPTIIHETVTVHDTIPCPQGTILVKPETFKQKVLRIYLLAAGIQYPLLLLFFLFIMRRWVNDKYFNTKGA